MRGSGAEILWDRWGVPHIFASRDTELFHAFGWAQARGHIGLLLNLYAQARGASSGLDTAGPEAAARDLQVHTLGIPGLARRWTAAQSRGFRACLDAFAQGINDWARAHPAAVEDALRPVLPVSAQDVMAHTLRLGFFTFSAWNALALAERVSTPPPAGSNAWAIGPSRTADRSALLLINPHLPWSDRFLFTEAHLVAPGLDFTGITLVGFPVLVMGFNDQLAWAHTVNTIIGANLYRVRPDRGGYRLDGSRRAFRSRKVRVGNETHHIQATVHGPIVARDADSLYALRVAGLDRPRSLEQWWNMGRSRTLAQFEKELARAQLPMMNVLYADADAHILYVDNGFIPVRRRGDWGYWSDVLPGDTSDTLWDGCHSYSQLPRVLDPDTGYLQNCNDPPWTCTHPPRLRPEDYPPYVAPVVGGLRAQRSHALLADERGMTLERMEALKHDTTSELALRLRDELVAAARRHGDVDARRAADVLRKWDLRTDSDSRGAVLFRAWRQEMASARIFAEVWSPARPLDTPRGLADPAAAAQALGVAGRKTREAFGSLDVPWGQAVRLRRGRYDLPANGGPGDALGVFRTLDANPDTDGKLRATDGDTWIAAVQMSRPLRARALLSYGNATEPGSPHHGDQLELFSKKVLRPVPRTRAEVESHREDREVPG